MTTQLFPDIAGLSRRASVPNGKPMSAFRRTLSWRIRGNSTGCTFIALAVAMFFNFLAVNVSVAAQSRFERPIFIVVPEEYTTNKSFGRSNLPFNNYEPSPSLKRKTTRYQQVYSASAFSRVPAGGAFITEIGFRAGCFSQNTIFFSNSQPFVISMSTTLKSPDGLSSRFSENIGSNVVITVTNQFFFFRADHGPCDSPENDPQWRTSIQLGTPFFYDPALGNLLIEMQVPLGYLESQDYAGGRQYLNEIASQSHDAVSRMAASGLTSEVADIIDTSGLVTQFTLFDFPKLNITQSNDVVTISWLRDPGQTQLEFTESLSGAPIWLLLAPPDTVSESRFRSFKIPVSDLKRPRYFRLFWASPQPGIVQP